MGCTECAPNFAPLGGSCIACPTQKWLTFIPLIVMLGVGGFIAAKLHKGVEAAVETRLAQREGVDVATLENRVDKGARGAGEGAELLCQATSLMTLAVFLQMYGAILGLSVPWQAELLQARDALASLVMFDAAAAGSPKCAGADITFRERWLLGLLLPFGPLLAALVLASCKRCYASDAWYGYDEDDTETVKLDGSVLAGDSVGSRALRKFYNASVGTFLLLYTLMAQTAVAPFDCTRAGASSVMRSNPDVRCEWGGSMADWSEWPVWTVCGGLAIASCAYAIVVVYRTVRRGARDGRLHTDERFMRAYGSLYMRYRDDCAYWEALVLGRKLLLELIVVLAKEQPWLQLVLCAVLFGGALQLQRRHIPYASDALNRIERDALSACCALVALAALAMAGVPPMVISVAATLLLAAVLMRVAQQMRRIWSGEDDSAQQLEWRPRSGSTERAHPVWNSGRPPAGGGGQVQMVGNPMGAHAAPAGHGGSGREGESSEASL